MSLSTQTIPVMVKYMRNLSVILDKGAKFCDEKGISHDDMLATRLIEDMRGIPYQVQSCSNLAKHSVKRLGGVESVDVWEDNETTFAELQTRITRTIDLLEGADAAGIDAWAEKELIMETKMGNFGFKSGQQYVSEYVLPKFYFHVTTAYCLFRHRGVPLELFDYLKDVFVKV